MPSNGPLERTCGAGHPAPSRYAARGIHAQKDRVHCACDPPAVDDARCAWICRGDQNGAGPGCSIQSILTPNLPLVTPPSAPGRRVPVKHCDSKCLPAALSWSDSCSSVDAMKRHWAAWLVGMMLVMVCAPPLHGQGLDPASAEALSATLRMLADPPSRGEAIGTPGAAEIDRQVQSLAGSSQLAQEMYEIAAAVFADLTRSSGETPCE